MNKPERFIIGAINRCLGKKDAPIYEYEENLYAAAIKISEQQDILPLFANAVLDSGTDIPAPVFDRLLTSVATSISRYENQMLCLKKLIEVFEANEIDYLTMKGTEIRKHYPSPEMRTSSDIDVLIREKDVERADALLQAAGLKFVEKGPHDLSYFSNAGVHLELHFQLFDEMREFYKFFENVWDGAILAGNTPHHYVMTPDDAYVYTIVHMLKHFNNAGSGARNVLDVYFLKKNTALNEEYISKTCEKMGADKFRKGVERLAGVWFGDAAEGDFESAFGAYVLRNGIYGTTHSRLAMRRTKKAEGYKNKFSYVFNYVFKPYSQMKIDYPSINKFPPLILIWWFLRGFKIFKKHNRRIFKSQVTVYSNLKDSELATVDEILRELGV